MSPSAANVPSTKDQTIENITDNVIAINSQSPDARVKFIFERLVTHLHDFARDTRLSMKEWIAGLMFLTSVGQECTADRQVGPLPSQATYIPLLLRCPGIYPPF